MPSVSHKKQSRKDKKKGGKEEKRNNGSLREKKRNTAKGRTGRDGGTQAHSLRPPEEFAQLLLTSAINFATISQFTRQIHLPLYQSPPSVQNTDDQHQSHSLHKPAHSRTPTHPRTQILQIVHNTRALRAAGGRWAPLRPRRPALQRRGS